MSTSTQRRKYSGAAILSKGYRPFFIGAAIWAIVSLFLWIFMVAGTFDLPSAFSPSDWHIHEMLFGYSGAVIAGFLLTAVPNWTGRFPIMGVPLLVLFIFWVLGRVAIVFSLYLSPFLVMGIDLAFPILLVLAIAREIIVGKNWRNLKVLAILVAFMLGNFSFHLEVFFSGSASYSSLITIGVVLLMVMVIGGRIIPSFTRNWLVRKNLYDLPAQFSRFDIITLVVSTFAYLSFVFINLSILNAFLLTIAGLFNSYRLNRWGGDENF